MDPIKGVLDEAFFKQASPDCLSALSKLMDDALGKRLLSYLNDPSADPEVVGIINTHLGEAIRAATFHLTLLERGSVQIVDKLALETLPSMRLDQQAVIAELEFISENMQYIHAYFEPRKKSDYDAFVKTLPSRYRLYVNDNRVMFYQPHARARATGVGIIVRKRTIWTIALKGLKYRDYMARAGYGLDTYISKEF